MVSFNKYLVMCVLFRVTKKIFLVTSKCHTLSDMNHLKTFGFRGEGNLIVPLSQILIMI